MLKKSELKMTPTLSIEELPFAVIILTKDKKIFQINRLAAKLLNLSKKQLSLPFIGLFSENIQEYIRDHLRSLRKVESMASFIIEPEVHNKKQYLRITISSFVKFYGVFLEDLTEEKQAFAIASHDIKSLITSIKAYIQLIQRKLPPQNDKLSSYISHLDSQADKLTSLIVSLLDEIRNRKAK